MEKMKFPFIRSFLFYPKYLRVWRSNGLSNHWVENYRERTVAKWDDWVDQMWQILRTDIFGGHPKRLWWLWWWRERWFICHGCLDTAFNAIRAVDGVICAISIFKLVLKLVVNVWKNKKKIVPCFKVIYCFILVFLLLSSSNKFFLAHWTTI